MRSQSKGKRVSRRRSEMASARTNARPPAPCSPARSAVASSRSSMPSASVTGVPVSRSRTVAGGASAMTGDSPRRQPAAASASAGIAQRQPAAHHPGARRLALCPRLPRTLGPATVFAMIWECAVRSERGPHRRRNEDALLTAPERRLFAVADGMGGHPAGDVAAALAVATLAAAFPGAPSPRIGPAALAARLRAAFADAHAALLAHGAAEPACRGLGTTLTALAPLASRPACVIAHIGDSRAYRLHGGALRQLTRDHTWVQEQLDRGMLSPALAASHPYRSVLSRVLGGGADPGPADVVVEPFRPGDLFLLCTDGVCGVVADADLEALLAQRLPLEVLAAQLVAATEARGAPDNLTLLLLRPVPRRWDRPCP
ncbi:MAG: serine/threonine-protein phosphatase, partial [Gemmatimonadetes bacterium]|nr:serine/threonine-protein phosphatase [Gemmatimonadota bacterium]